MVCITNKTVMLSRVIRGGYGERTREDVTCFILLILVLVKTSYGERRGRRITRGILVLEEEVLMGTVEGKAIQEQKW